MFYGIYTPNFGAETTPRLLADLAAEAEEAGWDGFSCGTIWSIAGIKNFPSTIPG
jgi:hypothetical protein